MNDRTNRTFICSIAFLDIVDYSQRVAREQLDLKQRFNQLIGEVIKDIAQNDRVVIDTGDGAALCFMGDPEDALFVVMNLRDRLRTPDTAALGLQIRIGINLGPVRLIHDINNHPNVLGDGINVAARVMSFAEPNQIMVSRSYYEVVSRLSQEYTRLFNYAGARTDKHVREHEVYEVGPSKEDLASDAAAAAAAAAAPPRAAASSDVPAPMQPAAPAPTVTPKAPAGNAEAPVAQQRNKWLVPGAIAAAAILALAVFLGMPKSDKVSETAKADATAVPAAAASKAEPSAAPAAATTAPASAEAPATGAGSTAAAESATGAKSAAAARAEADAAATADLVAKGLIPQGKATEPLVATKAKATDPLAVTQAKATDPLASKGKATDPTAAAGSATGARSAAAAKADADAAATADLIAKGFLPKGKGTDPSTAKGKETDPSAATKGKATDPSAATKGKATDPLAAKGRATDPLDPTKAPPAPAADKSATKTADAAAATKKVEPPKATDGAKAAAPISATGGAGTGTIEFWIAPFGDVVIDGKQVGSSPPLKVYKIPAGTHRIEIHNTSNLPHVVTVDVKENQVVRINKTFREN